jgi:hypothetical protein
VLYKAYVAALECEQRGDGAGVALAPLRAGRLEEGSPLAEAEFDQAGAIAACEGLGDAAMWRASGRERTPGMRGDCGSPRRRATGARSVAWSGS